MRDPVPSELGLIASLQYASDIYLTWDTMKHWLSLRQDLANFIPDLWNQTCFYSTSPAVGNNKTPSGYILRTQDTTMEGKTGKQ